MATHEGMGQHGPYDNCALHVHPSQSPAAHWTHSQLLFKPKCRQDLKARTGRSHRLILISLSRHLVTVTDILRPKCWQDLKARTGRSYRLLLISLSGHLATVTELSKLARPQGTQWTQSQVTLYQFIQASRNSYRSIQAGFAYAPQSVRRS